ncbi:class I SAM-dependent methyltransferase [Neptuniibacter sp.]|uniref:class I SAM-dependent methyltransferase n=1 Tax=Neptuniibacter sp. TaxID=1962643 RepID=UPI00262FAFBC|nr:class I SAM-dependent methyltransferase [Neptuniibacter sp.]MCP4597184.1 class I SAM-dependent methyltransferase [Neptuniibacter sp.]
MRRTKDSTENNFWDQMVDYDKNIISIFKDKDACRPLTKIIKLLVGSDSVIADLGTGTGNLLPYLHQAKQVFAVDKSLNMLEQARKKHFELENVEFIQSSIHEFSAPTKLDLAIAVSSLLPEQFSDFEKAINGILRNLKPGGDCILLLPSFEARLYYTNLQLAYFIEIVGLSESEAYKKVTSYHSKYMNNLFGYIRGQADFPQQKFWIKEELEERLCDQGLEDIELVKFHLPWNVYFDHVEEWYRTKPPMWMWLITAKRPQNLPLTIKAHHARFLASRVINAEADSPTLIKHLTSSPEDQTQLLELVQFNRHHHAWRFSDYCGQFSDGEHQHCLSTTIRDEVIKGSFHTSVALAILDVMQKTKTAYLSASSSNL